MQNPRVTIVVPLFNEEAVLPELTARLTQLMEGFMPELDVLFVDDGSNDHTPDILMQLSLLDSRFSALLLSRNFGHQAAITAGLQHARGTEGVLIMDGDLQDPPELLETFYGIYKEQGADVVYGVRKSRKEVFYKRWSYQLYYRLLKKFANIHIPLDSGDFCFLSRRVVDVLNQMPEESRFIRGLRAWVGFKQVGLPYDRSERAEGQPKYSFKRLMALALNGLFSFSEFPVKFIGRVGGLSIIAALVYFVYTLYEKFVNHSVPTGFTAMIFLIIFFAGIQLLSLGILGQYILRVFYQSKKRPLYIISQIVSKHG